MRAAVSRQGFTWLAVVDGRMQPHESPDRCFSFCRYRWAARARSRDIAVKGSNIMNLGPELSCVNVIRERCLFD
jgi:hypothetical protein